MISANQDHFRSLRLWLRDGVDVYICPDHVIHFVFLSTRKRLCLRVTPILTSSLEWFNGSVSVSELEERFWATCQTRNIIKASSFRDFVFYLYGKGILVPKNWMDEAVPVKSITRFSRQLNFFLDIEGTVSAGAILVWCANFSTICCVPKLPAQRE